MNCCHHAKCQACRSREDVILTEAEWRKVARVQIMFRKLAEDVLNEMGY